ncbi:DUF3696 domain-containing protein [Polyangium mundeleinium]|uniref:DUF3696 domain-containing protein n=1 Tax=Polyangium mundeleinium TaxID=2995306 RepID=A0ABT5EXW5_9BACT|nr:DUF3696 domain-containing protein [Polyangium mundeleinium]MDC0745660.1 DUF3696 domain-containing protein [Polyangium mundeleinium]
MISHLRIQHFKCFQDESIELRPLTVIAGANGVGKSSLLQSLLLAQQALETPADHVRLNGPFFLNLGTTFDVLCQTSEARTSVDIELSLDDGSTHVFQLEERKNEPFVLHITKRPSSLTPMDLTYLDAERMGPRDTLEMDPTASNVRNVGVRGEFTAQVLAELDLTRVREELRHPRTAGVGVQLGKQVELWLSDITPGIELRATTFPGTNISAIRLKRGGLMTEWLRPPNIGFGVSYALPVIVSGLLARPGALFLVENPEAHLHPAGQSRMGRFLGMLAAAGVQVLVETHSDHVLNGILLATVDTSHPLRHDQVLIQYFHGYDGKRQRAEAITVNARGGLSVWPAGFFDQSEKDMAAILEARRRG